MGSTTSIVIKSTPFDIANNLVAQHFKKWILLYELKRQIMEQLGLSGVQAMQQIRYLIYSAGLFLVSPSETCIPTFVTERNTSEVYAETTGEPRK